MNYISLYNDEAIKEMTIDTRSLTIYDFWQARYLNRRIKDGVYINSNGYYPSDYSEDYQLKNVITNIKLSIGEANYLDSIDYYKVEDRTSGHGRPVTRDLDLTSRDIKDFEAYLQSVTLPNENEATTREAGNVLR